MTATNITDTNLSNGTTYYYVVRWIDANGAESGDSTEMSATPTSNASRAARNTPPSILSNPVVLATAGQPYAYAVRASDPDPADTLTFSLPIQPSGMTIAPNGTIAWTPTNAQAGSTTVRVRVQDAKGNFATQQYTILVRGAAPTAPPVITSMPPPGGNVGQVYAYQVVANDPNPGAILTYSLPVRPAGMIIAANSGLLQWVPATGQIGSHSVTIRVDDQFGLSAVQSFAVSISAAPVANPVITSTPVITAIVDQPYVYQVTAVNPVQGQTLTFSLVGAPAGLTIGSATGLIQWTPAAAQQGAQNVTVRVQNSAGGIATQLFTIQVAPPQRPPTVTINSPFPSAVITQVTDVLGTITDNDPATPGPVTWALSMRRPGSAVYNTIATGSGAVANASVGRIDPTLLVNDLYGLKLTASKGPFQVSSTLEFSVAGNMKLGNFSVEFTDLSIPVAGIPITITRRYDSLDTSQGEFGAGWRLALPGQVRDNAGTNAYSTLTRVYVTRPDGRRIAFTFDPIPTGTFLNVWLPRFRPDPGVTDQLIVPDAALFNTGGTFFLVSGAFNPTLFTLRTKEGVQYLIDKNAGLQKITDLNGNTLTVTSGGLISSTGVQVTFLRDAQNRITRITEPGSSPGVLQYGYDAAGNLTSFRDQLNNQTQYFYENAAFPNYLSRIQDPLGRAVIRNVYDAAGRVIAQCDANGNPATLAGCAIFNPNAAGRLQTIVNARGFRTDLILDARGNVLTERRWLDGSTFLDTVRTYDANDNTLTETDPAGNRRTYTYDAAGNRLSETDPGGRTTRYTFGICNKALTQTDPAGNVTTYTYDANCNLTTVRDALGAVTTYQYSVQGQQTAFIDAIGSRWTWAYNASGFVTSLTDPFGKSTTFTFSPTGDLLTRIDRNNRRIDFQYDAAHRLIRETWDTTPARVTNYAYNATGQLTSASDPDSALALTYTNTGRLLSVDNAGTPGVPRVLMTYAYDGNGNVTSVQDSLGGITAYAYDALDRLSRVTQSGTGVQEKRVDYQYDSASFLTKQSRFSDLAGTQPVINTFFETDCNGCPGRITAIRHRKASDNNVIHDLTYVRDALGNIISSTDAEGTHSYTYDRVRRLLTATHSNPAIQPNEFYTYDAVGNRLSSHLSNTYIYSYMSGVGNRLTQDQQFYYQYDDEGNMIKKTSKTTGEDTKIGYDFRNRTVAVARSPQGSLSVVLAQYRYDFANRRILVVGQSQTDGFVYDALNPALKLTTAGISDSRRLYARSIDAIMADELTGQTRWFLSDHLLSTRDLASSTASLRHDRYDSFGLSRSAPGNPVQTEILFAGREYDPATNLQYLRARLYDPSNGRFLSEDPLEAYGYEYSKNNPLVYTDRTGLTAGPVYAFVLTSILYAHQAYGIANEGLPGCRAPNGLGTEACRNQIVALFASGGVLIGGAVATVGLGGAGAYLLGFVIAGTAQLLGTYAASGHF